MDCSPPGSSVRGILQQEYCSGLPVPPPGSLPDPGLKPTSPALAGRFFTTEPPGIPVNLVNKKETDTFVILNMDTMVLIESVHLITDM